MFENIEQAELNQAVHSGIPNSYPVSPGYFAQQMGNQTRAMHQVRVQKRMQEEWEFAMRQQKLQHDNAVRINTLWNQIHAMQNIQVPIHIPVSPAPKKVEPEELVPPAFRTRVKKIEITQDG